MVFARPDTDIVAEYKLIFQACNSTDGLASPGKKGGKGSKTAKGGKSHM